MTHNARLRKSARRGALTLEWILLVTVLVIGIIGGLGAVRNATNGELIDLAEAIEAINVLPDPPMSLAIESEDDHPHDH
jgi:hypothetical protein